MNDSTQPERKLRADALRNRERILYEAKIAFARDGLAISMEDVARQAGVGAGTLYRNFATREALLEGVYRTEVGKLAEEERKLSDTLPPLEALREWMLLFIDYISAKKIIAPALNSIVGGPSKLFEASGGMIKDAIQSLVTRAIASGDIRADLVPLDLLRALVGVSNNAETPDWQESAKRLVEILLIGSRPKQE